MPLITAKTATINAKMYFDELTGINEMSLDEVELSEDEKYWFITLGYDDLSEGLLLTIVQRKKYKVFKVNAENGQVISMKIRQVITE